MFLIFGSVQECFGRELLESKVRDLFLALEIFFFLFLFVLAEPRLGGGVCVLFSLFFYCLASKNKLSINGLSNLVSVVLAKPCVCKWFC